MNLQLVGILLIASISSPVFAEDDIPKGSGECRPRVEELHANRKKLKDCLQTWVQSAKAGTENPSDNCTGATLAFVEKTKEIKACRAEQKAK